MGPRERERAGGEGWLDLLGSRERELDEVWSVVGLQSIGGGRLDLLGPRERESRVGRSLAAGRSVRVGSICWVQERELGEGRSVVGRRSIGGY